MAIQPKRFCLFNCDNTYDLKVVEEFLLEEDEKGKYKIHVDSLYFGLRRMTEMVETTLPTLKMDFAIFVVHANESSLSINDDNAGIGYARLYKALLRATDDKVLIVIGGDSYYKDEDEEDRSVISRWARRKVASQFNEEYLDGRKSFIFSWDTKHRPIHEEALRHFLDPSKKGIKFVYTPKPKPLPRAPEPEFILPASKDARQEPFLVEDEREELLSGYEKSGPRRRSFSDREGQKRQEWKGDKKEGDYGAISPGASGPSPIYPAETVLLETRMRYGEISYHSEDILKWKERWQPSERLEDVLRKHHQKKPEVKVRFYSDEYGRVQCTVTETAPGYFTLLKDYLCFCFAWLWNRLCSCFLWLWNRLCTFRPRLRGTVTRKTPDCLTRF